MDVEEEEISSTVTICHEKEASKETIDVINEERKKKGKEESTPPHKKVIITEEDLKKHPVKRPAIKGKIHIIEDRPIDILKATKETGIATPVTEIVAAKLETIKKGTKEKENKKKEETGPKWQVMELFSSLTEDPSAKEKAEQLGKMVVDFLCGGGKDPPPLLREAGSQPAPSSSSGTKEVVLHKRRISEARKKRKKEKRREKRREEARRRAAASAPPSSTPKSGARTTGPMTRSQTRAGAPPPIPSASHPAPPNPGATLWTKVVGRTERKKQQQATARTATPATAAFIAAGKTAAGKAPDGVKQRGGTPTAPQNVRKPPRTAAVQIACPEGERAETMRLARTRINLEELGIKELRPRRARTGALLLEISGAEGAKLTDVLAEKMKEALSDRQGVLISRPHKTAKIRLRNVEDSISTGEIAPAVAEKGGCSLIDIQVGPTRTANNDLGTVWVR